MNVGHLSTLRTISFTNPRLDPDSDGDFCVYFTLETPGAETFVTDLALFVRDLGKELIRWSVLGHPDRLNPDNPAHPVLRDLTYCWDGVTCVHGVLQFSASPVSVMNIRRVFHRTSRIFGPFCQAHRYEYFASGIFLDVERAVIPVVFSEMEAAAQYVFPNQFPPFFKSFTCGPALGSYATTMPFLSMSRIAPSVSHTETEVREFFFSLFFSFVFEIHVLREREQNLNLFLIYPVAQQCSTIIWHRVGRTLRSDGRYNWDARWPNAHGFSSHRN